ncbi:MAG: long-chain fatty acid--CoA ligase, partial [Deltaproteobacteria bacterium]|nr:long-chain fatty acid--CoA ligase [Deltaproteobacteria bacterium]
ILAPLFHATALYGQLLRSIYMGSTCVISHKFQAIDAMQAIENEKINVCVAVPTIFWLMMVHGDFNKFNLSSLRRIIYGGSPASESFVRQIASNFPEALQINAYGLTECTSVATTLPPSKCLEKIGSIGLAVPFSEIEIIDPSSHILPPGAIGELIIRGPQVCQGYWKNTNSTSSTFHGGWLHTGDLAKKDANGFIYLMDRKKDMIIRGGENIYSVEVENILYNHPKVLEAAVVGVPDKIFGEQVKACIVLKRGEVSDGNEIREFCRYHLADYKIPKFIEFLDTLPRNHAGKIMKEKLL